MINFRLNFWERRLHLKLQNRKYTPRKTLVDGRDEVRDSCQKPSRPPTTPGPSEHMGAAGICFHFLLVTIHTLNLFQSGRANYPQDIDLSPLDLKMYRWACTPSRNSGPGWRALCWAGVDKPSSLFMMMIAAK